MHARPPEADELCRLYLEAQLRGDRREAVRLVTQEARARGLQPSQMLLVLRDAQREIGRLWQENRISIAEEHMATAISVMALAHLFDETEVTARLQRTVLVACVEGELHDFAARLAADALEHGGFTVRFLGASVPTDHLVRMLREDPPDLLVLTVTMAFNLPAARTAVARVREAMGDRVKIAVGGGALGGAAAGGLGADFTGADAGELVVEATQVLGGSR